MRKIFTLLLLTISILGFSQIPTGYYDDAEGLSGDDLKSALYNIINGHTELSYDALWTVLKESDEDPDNSSNFILIYTGRSLSKSSTYPDWNREHVWAKSHGDFGTTMGAGTDAHHLRPCDVSVNSSRGNKDFDNGGTPHSEATGCFSDSDSWEPRDAVKGDVARMIFYMATRYNGESGDPNLNVNDQVDNGTSPYHGKLSALLEWNEEDPPDDFERNKNEVVYSYQHNRNPYIDHPEYVGYIWEGTTPDVPAISNIIYSPENPEPETSISVTAKIVDNNSISSATLKWCTDGSSFDNNITMTDTDNDDVFNTSESIPGQANGTTISFKIEAIDNESNTTTSSVVTITIDNSSNILEEDFSSCPPSGWTIYSLAGSADWNCNNEMSINAYGADVASDDWLISPAIDLSAYSNEKLSFESWTQYTDVDFPQLTLKYSTNYTGSGDPSSADWTELSFTTPAENSQTWTSSGEIDISAISGTSVSFALQYISSGTAGASSSYWKVDDFVISAETGSGGEDTTAPEFTSGFPVAENISANGFDIKISLNEPGKVYYKSQLATLTAPTITEVQAEDFISITVAGTEFSNSISDLEKDTEYSVYFVAQDDEATPNVQSSLTKIDVTTLQLDEDSPEFITNYPKATNIGGTSFDVVVSINEVGKVFFLKKENDASAPTIDEILLGDTILISEANTEYSALITNLSPETDYDIYFIAQDNAETPNTQTSASKLDVTTDVADNTAPEFITNYPAIQDINSTGFNIAVQLNEKGYFYYKVQNPTSAAPNIQEVVAANKVNINEANTEILVSVNDLETETAYIIYCIASDDETNINMQDTTVVLEATTILGVPVITRQPQVTIVCEGSEVLFVVGVNTFEGTEFRWYFNQNQIPNQTNDSLYAASIDLASSGKYHCLVSNSVGTVSTDTVMLYIDIPVYAGKDTSISVCNTSESIDLFLLLPNADTNGTWFDNNQTGAVTNSIFDVSLVENGNYTFTYYVDGNTCDDDHSVITISVNECNSVKELQFANNIIFPNPTKGIVFINTNYKANAMSVYNISGQKLLQKQIRPNQNELNLSELSNGLYFIIIQTNQGYFRQKISILK